MNQTLDTNSSEDISAQSESDTDNDTDDVNHSGLTIKNVDILYL
jgi:hypothetical protein